jgi:FecR protein
MRFLSIIVAAAAVLAPGAVAAQEPADSDPPAHVSFVDGVAVIERDGQTDSAPANMPLLAGDRIRTEAGRVEILYADGSTLHLDHNTTVDFQSDELVRVLDGRVRLTIAGRPRDLGYRIDGPNAWAQIAQPGEYRFAILRNDRGAEVDLAVLRGAAELVNDDGRTPLRAGERAFARSGEAPSYAYVFNSATWDAFDRWSEARRDYRLGLSSQYLPEPVRPYSRAFDQYGSWRHEPEYGYVWYPRVTVGWRPYYYGRWATFRPWGWFWVGTDPWAWPTHHYGRWGYSAGAWFWIPGRTWGAAWVSWAYAPGYVSWCPLGWYNRPVIPIGIQYARYNPWHAWTVVSYGHFGRGYVHQRAVHWQTGAPHARVTWTHRDSAPAFRGYAVPRAQAPIRVVGRAVPRGSGTAAPVYTNLPRDGSRVQSAGPRIQVDETRSSDGRARAVPRANASEVPRMTPNRGVRSRAAGSGTTGADTPDRRRAVPRSPAGAESVPSARPDGGAPDSRRSPMIVPRQPGEASGGTAQRPNRGVRAVPRSAPAESGAAAPARSPYERRAPAGAGGGGDDSAWRSSRQPVERRAPGGEAGGERAVPRSAPQARPEMSVPAPYQRRVPGGWSVERAAPRSAPQNQPEPSMPAPYERRAPGGGSGERAVPRRAPDAGSAPSAPSIERSAPPSRSVDVPRGPERSAPPSRTRPGGGDSGGGAGRGGGDRRAAGRRG